MSEQRVADRPAVRERRIRLVGLAVSAISLGAVVWWVSQQPAPELPSTGGELAALGAAIALYAAATVLRGERWWWMLRRAGGAPGRADAYALTTVGYMGNNVLPARGGDAMRVFLLAPRGELSMRGTLGTLVAERLLDAAVLLSLFCILAYGVLSGIDAPSAARLGLVAAAVVVVAAAGATALYSLRRHPRVARALGFLAPIAAATRNLRGGHGIAMTGLSLAIWSAEAATYLAVGGAIGLDMNPLEALYLVALASVFVLIPSGPGYAGTLDAAVLFGARAIGATGAQSVSYLIMLRFVLLVPITIAGLLLLLARYGGWRSVRTSVAEVMR